MQPMELYENLREAAGTEAPEVAVGALIVNGDVWTIKGAVAARAVVDAWVQRQKTAGKSD